MPTLSELGIAQNGDFLDGDRDFIGLNKEGVDHFNNLYPTLSGIPNFSDSNHVVVNRKLPRQEYSRLTARIKIAGNCGSVSSLAYVQFDDWFRRLT
jgi:hypothetical protein